MVKKVSSGLKNFRIHSRSRDSSPAGNFEWRHVSTHENPADVLSRGQFPNESLNNKSWFSGPDWLNKNKSFWPRLIISTTSELLGLKVLMLKPISSLISNRLSLFSRLVNAFAYIGKISVNKSFKVTDYITI